MLVWDYIATNCQAVKMSGERNMTNAKQVEAAHRKRAQAKAAYLAACREYRVQVGQLASAVGNKQAADMLGISKARVSQMRCWPDGMPKRRKFYGYRYRQAIEDRAVDVWLALKKQD